MRGDGRPQFFRDLNLDKDMKKLLRWFIDLKTKMLKGRDEYSNGKIHNTDIAE